MYCNTIKRSEMNIITRLEEVILLAIWKLKDNAYGVTIVKEVSKLTNKKYTMGSLYFSLDQLFKKGLVTKISGTPTSERGGRGKTYYLLAVKGAESLQAAKEFEESIWSDIPHSVIKSS